MGPEVITAAGHRPSVAGVCVVRDARDIIPFICGHYLRVGFSHISFIDDGSTDGTFEFLHSLARRTNRISVRRVIDSCFDQYTLMNEAVGCLVDAGYRIIVPFDADEFWSVEAAELEKRLVGKEDIAFLGRWVNFVQMSHLTHPRSLGLFQIKYRAMAMADADQHAVIASHRPFVSHSDTKIAFKTSKRVKLLIGQHSLEQEIETCIQAFEIFHIPLRYRSELEKRGINYEPRRTLTRKDSGQSWQSAFHAHIVESNRVEEVWRANSASRAGYLDAYGKQYPLIPDKRLRRLLMKASAFLAWRFRMIAG